MLSLQCSPKQITRFWSKVNKHGALHPYNPELGRCWNWTRAQNGFGYGSVWLNNHHHRAHRVSYFLTFGDIRDGLFVCHSCDNPLCVNPDHLFLGSAADNNRDKEAKGREVVLCGEKQGLSKLTAAQVAEIRQRYATGHEMQIHLAKEFGVSQHTIWGIVRYKTWLHIP